MEKKTLQKRSFLPALCFFFFLSVIWHPCVALAQPQERTDVSADSLIEAPYGVLMEASTGQVIYEKEKDTQRSPASITKIMTLILIFDALEEGSVHMDDLVTTSAYAKSMGGSQVFLEEGE
ncbi:MAG TPA: D-alanyl-D-alanine carboxypeptidase, partial [Candidatus Blautia avistercoris]|nr:D-alanyl-D-alanine carboxypeptidase [Candidatus Blautia avistercoris]